MFAFSSLLRILRARFLLLTPFTVSAGVILSLPSNPAPIHILLVYLGLMAAHASVNVLNDYFDFVDGIDSDPKGIHGGSGVLAAHLMSASGARSLGVSLLVLSLATAVYFLLLRGPLLLIFILPAYGSLIFYSRLLARKGFGPLTAFLNWGPLMVGGTHFALSGTISSPAFFVGTVVGVYVGLLLHLHDLPDYTVDRATGKRTLAVILGLENSVHLAYLLLFLPYGLVLLGLLFRLLHTSQLVIFAALPISLYLLTRLRLSPDSPQVQKLALLTSLAISWLTAASLGIGY